MAGSFLESFLHSEYEIDDASWNTHDTNYGVFRCCWCLFIWSCGDLDPNFTLLKTNAGVWIHMTLMEISLKKNGILDLKKRFFVRARSQAVPRSREPPKSVSGNWLHHRLAPTEPPPTHINLSLTKHVESVREYLMEWDRQWLGVNLRKWEWVKPVYITTILGAPKKVIMYNWSLNTGL